MALYEFQCKKCGRKTEVIQLFSDPAPTKCPHCGGALAKLLSSPAFQFKGSGFYSTDYAKPGGKPEDSSKEKEGDSSKEKEGDSSKGKEADAGAAPSGAGAETKGDSAGDSAGDSSKEKKDSGDSSKEKSRDGAKNTGSGPPKKSTKRK